MKWTNPCHELVIALIADQQRDFGTS